jgi:beta-glucosidase
MAGRTYRYMNQEALYPFGFGLSYTDFTAKAAISQSVIAPEESIECQVTLKNTGKKDGTETVQVYVKALDTEGAPKHQLKGIKKVFLKAGEETEVSISLPAKAFALYDEEGILVLNAGNYEVFAGTSQPDQRSILLTGKTPDSFKVTVTETVVLE